MEISAAVNQVSFDPVDKDGGGEKNYSISIKNGTDRRGEVNNDNKISANNDINVASNNDNNYNSNIKKISSYPKNINHQISKFKPIKINNGPVIPPSLPLLFQPPIFQSPPPPKLKPSFFLPSHPSKLKPSFFLPHHPPILKPPFFPPHHPPILKPPFFLPHHPPILKPSFFPLQPNSFQPHYYQPLNFNNNNIHKNSYQINKINYKPIKTFKTSKMNNNKYKIKNDTNEKKEKKEGEKDKEEGKKKKENIKKVKNLKKEEKKKKVEEGEKEEEEEDNFIKIKAKIHSLHKKIQREKLYINLIFFDENITNDENKKIYDYFQLNVVGGFHGFSDINILKKYFTKFEENNLPFILISSGSSFNKIINICLDKKFIITIIIYCHLKNNYQSLYGNYTKIKLIENDLNKLISYLKEIKFKSHDIDMKNQIHCNPLISFYEYEKCYFIFHEAFSYFFKKNFSTPKFKKDYMKETYSFIEKSNEYDSNTKDNLKQILEDLTQSNTLAEDFLREYTSENGFVYFFNKIMRRIENGILQLSFFIGPTYYSLIRYIKYHPNKGLEKDTKLYRYITINDIDLNFYQIAIGHIIVFPAFTSTSIKTGFSPTNKALKLNKVDNGKIEIEMTINYKYSNGNISPGIIVGNLSNFENEKEILLFPFLFIKITNLSKVDNNHYKLYCDIINRKKILEFDLKNGKKIILNNNNELDIKNN